MRAVSLSELSEIDLDVRDVVVFPAVWAERKTFFQYWTAPRPVAALFLVLSDISGAFTEDDGTRTPIQKGDVVYIPGGIRYHAAFNGGKTETQMDTITVNFRLLDDKREDVLLSEHITVLAHEPNGLFDTYFHRLCESVHLVGEVGSRLRQKADFYALLDAILAFDNNRKESYYPIRRGMEGLCHEWNRNERIEKYAELCGMSVGYFYRLFRRTTGMSPVEYRNLLRISNARSILINTRLSIREVATVVGFDDPFYFCRVFKKQTGIAPGEYRKANHGIEIPE